MLRELERHRLDVHMQELVSAASILEDWRYGDYLRSLCKVATHVEASGSAAFVEAFRDEIKHQIERVRTEYVRATDVRVVLKKAE